jgi:hypothetical protein
MSFFAAEPFLYILGVGKRGVANTLVKSIDMGVFNTESVGLGVEVVLAAGFFCDARGDMQIMLFLSSLTASPSRKKDDEDTGARAAAEGV